MLQGLTLKNFKLFDEEGVTLNPGKITVLIGVNGTGKSSVLQALLLLKQSLNQGIPNFSGPLVPLGAFSDVVHAQDVGQQVTIGIDASYQGLMSEGMTPHLPESGTFHDMITFSSDTMTQAGKIGGESEDKITFSVGGNFSDIIPNQITVNQISTISLGGMQSIGTPIMISGYSQEDPARTPIVISSIQTLLGTIRTLLEHCYNAPALRGFASLAYEIMSGHIPCDLSAVSGPEGQAQLVANILASNPELTDEITVRLSAILNGTSRLRYRLANGRVATEMAAPRRGVNLINESFGLNQLVALLVSLSIAPVDSVIGIEEPEIHLHPKAQAALCDIFVDVVMHERKQIIITTHSEHILMSLLTSVAKRKMQPTDLAVYEFQRQEDTARAERLEVNQFGQIAGGLKGFLETDLDEIGDLIKARFSQKNK